MLVFFNSKIFRNPVNLTTIVKVGDVGGGDRLRTQFSFQSESMQYIPVREIIKCKLILVFSSDIEQELCKRYHSICNRSVPYSGSYKSVQPL